MSIGTFVLGGGILVVMLIIFVAAQAQEGTRKVAVAKKYETADPQLRQDVISGVIRVGMTEQQVIDSWGRPMRRTFTKLKTKDKTILYFRNRNKVYLDNGIVTGWHTPDNRG